MNPSIADSSTETLMVLFKIIGRRSWDELQSWREAIPGSRVEHVLHGIYVLIIEPGGARAVAAESTDTSVILRRVEHNADWRRGEPAGEFLRQQWAGHSKGPEDFAAERGLGTREFRENLSAVRAWVGVNALRWTRLLTDEARGER